MKRLNRLILASKSPRRKELLENLGVSFEIMVKETEEDMTSSSDAIKLASHNALAKAKALQPDLSGEAFVLSADTIVKKDNILGKPMDQKHAFEMLRELSGTYHEVVTAVAILHTPTGKAIIDAVTTKVYFKSLRDEEIHNYIASGEPMDKAGAYGIQGKAALFVEKIEGDYFNVVGLPLFRIEEMLKQHFNKSLLLDFSK